MQRVIQRLNRFFSGQDGATAVEYAVMLALILLVCLAGIVTLGTNTKNSLTNSAQSIAS